MNDLRPSLRTCTAGMISISRNGMTITASSSDTIRLMVIVHGNQVKKSPIMPVIVKRIG